MTVISLIIGVIIGTFFGRWTARNDMARRASKRVRLLHQGKMYVIREEKEPHQHRDIIKKS